MLGILLLCISLFLYFRKNYAISLLLFISFCLNGLSILPDYIIGTSNSDLALIYTIIISILNYNRKGYFKTKGQENIVYVIICFLLLSSIFSKFYYHLTFFQIIQASRADYIILSYFFLRRVNSNLFLQIYNYLQNITLITSILYICQIIIGKAILPYPVEGSVDLTAGIMRFYNYPPLLTMFFVSSFIFPQFIKRSRVNLYRIIFSITIVCTLGRTFIIANIIVLLIGLYIQGGLRKSIQKILILGILLIPFMDIITTRFSKGNTSEDLLYILNTRPEDLQEFTTGGTMTYRIAWFLERYYYLIDRPFLEKIFGLGLISDSQPYILKMYDFKVGATGKVGSAGLMTTPDFAWGNLLTHWGLGGMILITIFWLFLLYFFFKRSKYSVLSAIAFTSFLSLIIQSFSGSTISRMGTIAIYLLFISTIKKQVQNKYGKN